MSALMEMARQHADGDDPADPTTPAGQVDPDQLVPFVDVDDATSDDPPAVPVVVAWARVMRDVQGVAKKGLYNAGGTRYNFRGVDAMINAFGPVCRKHGVIVLPVRVVSQHAPATSVKGSAMRETTAVVSWKIYGPAGDFLEGESEGESLDSSDKGTAKAQSVALRAFLSAAGLVPTDEKDPDSVVHERGERATVDPLPYRDEIADPKTSAARLRQMRVEIQRHRIGGVLVVNERGDDEALMAMLDRLGRERAAAEGGAE